MTFDPLKAKVTRSHNVAIGAGAYTFTTQRQPWWKRTLRSFAQRILNATR